MHEAWPKAHHRASPDLAIRQRQLCSGARPSAQPYVASRDEIGIASDHFKAGNDRNASPGELDFMHGRMTSRHEGCVSTMLTESGLSIALPVRHFKGLCDRMRGARRQAPCCGALSVLTTERFGPIAKAASLTRRSRSPHRHSVRKFQGRLECSELSRYEEVSLSTALHSGSG